MKVLWFSNKELISSVVNSSGTWLSTMANNLSDHSEIEIVNITEADTHDIQTKSASRMVEYVLPKFRLSKGGLPSISNIEKIKAIVENEHPDIIHVWGVEKYWGLLFARKHIIGYHTILDIQGVLEACDIFYKGELSFHNFLKEMNFFDALYAYGFVYLQKLRMHKRIKNENEIIKSFSNIGYQSEWVRNWVFYKNPSAKLYKSYISVRSEFCNPSTKWKIDNPKTRVTIVASGISYKRLDVAIKAFNIIHNIYPDIQLSIVGYKPDHRGFSRCLTSLIQNYRLNKSIECLGNLQAGKIIDLYKKSYCSIISSSVESYSVVLAESIAYGIPCVVSYAGALPEFKNRCSQLLYFPSGDFVTCANMIIHCIQQGCEIRELETISDLKVAENQLDVYKAIIKNQ